MKIKLKLPLAISQALGVEAYVITKDFSLSSSLLQAVLTEGDRDCLDDHDGSETSPSSPPSSVPSSPSPSCSFLPQPLPLTRPSPVPPPPSKLCSPSTLNQSNARKRKIANSKASGKRNRKRKRQEAGPKTADSLLPHANPVSRFVPDSKAVSTGFSLSEDAPVASTAYVGLLDEREVGGNRTWSLDELVGSKSTHDFTVIKAVAGTTVPFIDSEDRLVALIVYPKEDSIKVAAEDAAKLLQEEHSQASFTTKQKKSCRGKFPQISAGVAHGGGRTKPANIVHNSKNAKVLGRLVSSEAFQRLSGFATSVFKTWAPDLYNYCQDHLERLLASDDTLVRLFKNSVLPVAAFNFGPRTVCLPHIDFGNLPFNWCWIWSLGWFNWTRGGHLILWDLRVVIEFPPGSLAAIPSGVCRHSNTCIGKHDKRYSFTQYAPGANFRWVDHGFQTEEMYMASRSQAEADAEDIRKRNRWEMGLGLFPTLSSLGLCRASGSLDDS